MIATILQGGFHTSMQDAGRIGWRRFGISSGGACDGHGARVSNLLAGNEEGAAVLEIALGGLRLEVEDERLVAWTGGAFTVRIQGQAVPAGRPAVLAPGEQIAFAYASHGCRAWLAVSGGFEVPVVLGSRSTDLRAGFGGWEGRALRGGDRLPLGASSPAALSLMNKLSETRVAAWSAPATWSASASREPVLRIIRGEEWERFGADAHAKLLQEPFTVTPDANRMGLRLDGPPLSESKSNNEMLSAAVVPGTLQVPTGGKPILLLADCQTIGGYPKLAHVITMDLPAAAQLRPGDTVRFREITLGEAHRLLLEREQEVARFRLGLALQAR